jgi:glucose 1-dehydrogenase
MTTEAAGGALDRRQHCAVVTGGGSGIGAACCLALAAEGYRVAVACRGVARGERVVEDVKRLGGEAMFVRTDVSVEQDCENLVSAAEERLGPIEVLVAAAGILTSPSQNLDSGSKDSGIEQPYTDVVNLSLSAWSTVLDINLTGSMLSARAAARRMLANAEGPKSIVMVSSGSGTRPIPGRAEYCVSKAGVNMFTKVLARELAQHNIRVNCVAPGRVLTPMTTELFGVLSPDGVPKDVPLRRFATSEEIANAIVFLTSERASYITGEILFVDGGKVAY